MAAIFAVGVAVCRKLPAAGGTGEMIKGLLLHLVSVTIPPVCPAAIRTEFSGLLFGNDFDGLSAILARDRVFYWIAQLIAAAERAHRVV